MLGGRLRVRRWLRCGWFMVCIRSEPPQIHTSTRSFGAPVLTTVCISIGILAPQLCFMIKVALGVWTYWRQCHLLAGRLQGGASRVEVMRLTRSFDIKVNIPAWLAFLMPVRPRRSGARLPAIAHQGTASNEPSKAAVATSRHWASVWDDVRAVSHSMVAAWSVEYACSGKLLCMVPGPLSSSLSF